MRKCQLINKTYKYKTIIILTMHGQIEKKCYSPCAGTPCLWHLLLTYYASSLQITNHSFRYAPVESASSFIPSTSSCSLSSWFISSCTHHLITVPVFSITICYSRLKTHLFHKSLPPWSFWFHLDCFNRI